LKIINNQLKNIKESLWIEEKTHLKKITGLNLVLLGRPGHRSTRTGQSGLPSFCSSQFFILSGLVQLSN